MSRLLSQREAARAWGLGRSSIQRAIAAGKLSLTSEKRLDPAEMVRVFGEPGRPSGPLEATSEPPIEQVARVAQLEAEVRLLRELVQRADAERDRALADKQRAEQQFLLTHDGAQKRRWWHFGRRGGSGYSSSP